MRKRKKEAQDLSLCLLAWLPKLHPCHCNHSQLYTIAASLALMVPGRGSSWNCTWGWRNTKKTSTHKHKKERTKNWPSTSHHRKLFGKQVTFNKSACTPITVEGPSLNRGGKTPKIWQRVVGKWGVTILNLVVIGWQCCCRVLGSIAKVAKLQNDRNKLKRDCY